MAPTCDAHGLFEQTLHDLGDAISELRRTVIRAVFVSTAAVVSLTSTIVTVCM